MKTAFIFPGQGSQYIGMGRDFYDNFSLSKDVFEEANEALNMNLSHLIFNGHEDELKKTENTQPAILATSIAMLRMLEKEGFSSDYTAGLSLGEYSSLVYANGINFSDAIKIVRERGKFMQEAVPLGIGGMAAILGLGEENYSSMLEAGKKAGIVEIANYNCPGQIVITGEKQALHLAREEALKLGAKRVVELPVSGAFHCSLLNEAGKRLEDELSKYKIHDLDKNLVSNVDAKITRDRDDLKEKLVKQVSNSVLWQQSIEFIMDEGVDTFIEIGPSKSLTAFVKKIGKNMGKDIKTLNVSDIDSFNEVLKHLRRD